MRNSKWDKLRYDETFCSIECQIKLLRDRGLVIRDDARAHHALEVIGYHRLRDYFRHFYIDYTLPSYQRRFKPNCSFNSVLNLYYLDRELRFFLLGPLEKIEVSLRGAILDALGEYHLHNSSDIINILDRKWYNLNNPSNEETYQRVKQAVFKSIFHLSDKKTMSNTKTEWENAQCNPEEMNKTKLATMAPWPIIHKLSFGPLYSIVSILNSDLVQNVSTKFNVTAKVLRSSLSVLKNVRNACAHHEPIWFRSPQSFHFPNNIKPLIWPKSEASGEPIMHRPFRVYEVCAMIHYYLCSVSENTTWYKRLRPLIERFDSESQKRMGFPNDWSDFLFWRTTSHK